jgi:predicted TIM-barrel fold metal-dependent hydrolase
MKIDTHLHILFPERLSYPWTETFKPLQGRFSLEDYRAASAECGITGSLFMEVDVAPEQAADEAAFFCKLTEDPANGLLGVIAGGCPENAGFSDYLDRIAHPNLKGIRRILHMAPDEVSQSETFRQNIRELGKRKLPFDLCVRPDQLALTLDLIDACPDTSFILDHCGNPDVASGDHDSWASGLKQLAERQNLAVKISGIPAACPSGKANADTLRAWVETSIATFGWDRVLWGGDWPVCTLNGSFASWCETLDKILASESPQNLQRLYQKNAQLIYNL